MASPQEEQTPAALAPTCERSPALGPFVTSELTQLSCFEGGQGPVLRVLGIGQGSVETSIREVIEVPTHLAEGQLVATGHALHLARLRRLGLEDGGWAPIDGVQAVVRATASGGGSGGRGVLTRKPSQGAEPGERVAHWRDVGTATTSVMGWGRPRR